MIKVLIFLVSWTFFGVTINHFVDNKLYSMMFFAGIMNFIQQVLDGVFK